MTAPRDPRAPKRPKQRPRQSSAATGTTPATSRSGRAPSRPLGQTRSPKPSPIDNFNLPQALRKIRRAVRKSEPPAVGREGLVDWDPFKVLIATLLSARTKDAVTAEASVRLFRRAATPEEMRQLTEKEIARLIYPVGFYKTKAKAIRKLCRVLVEEHDGQVPNTLEELLELPGVGRKTANLVLTEGFRKPGICVDTHVHRITNIWGYVRTKTPYETEMALREKLPRRYWLEFNDLLVSFGQTICTPVSPWCSRCPIADECPRIGVSRWR